MQGILEILLREEWLPVRALLKEDQITLTKTAESFASSSPCSEPAKLSNSSSITSEERTVKIIKKSGSGLGISIKGGSENNMPIIVSKIFKGMAADRCKDLFVGDSILQVNENDMRSCSHDQAVHILKSAGQEVDMTVKYLKHISQHLPQHSSLQNLSWTYSDESLSPGEKVLALKHAYVSKGISYFDQNILEIRSPDNKHVVILRAGSTEDAASWLNVLLLITDRILQESLLEVNTSENADDTSYCIQTAGWLSEQIFSSHGISWSPVFCALTPKCLRLYATAPLCPSDWQKPVQSLPLITTRLSHSGKVSDEELVFGTRTGTRVGVEAHTFRVESIQQLELWCKSLVETTHASVNMSPIMAWPVILPANGQRCLLQLHCDDGFKLLDSGQRQTLWKFPFSSLTSSADDGTAIVWLTFSGSRKTSKCFKVELKFNCCPKPFVFALHTFLAALVSKLGLPS